MWGRERVRRQTGEMPVWGAGRTKRSKRYALYGRVKSVRCNDRLVGSAASDESLSER